MRLPRTAVAALVAACLATLAGACRRGPARLRLRLPDVITRADVPEKMCEGVHAVYLYDVASVDFDYDGLACFGHVGCATSRMTKIHLCDRAATEHDHYGTISIDHPGPLHKLEAYVEKPDGRITKLGEQDFRTTTLIEDGVQTGTGAVDFNRTSIVFPDLSPGDEIAYRYLLGKAVGSWTFQREDALVLYSRFQVSERLMEHGELEVQIMHPERVRLVQPAKSSTPRGFGPSRDWRVYFACEVRPFPAEPQAPPADQFESRIELHGEQDPRLNAFAVMYFMALFTRKGTTRNPVADLAGSLTRGCEDDTCRIKTLRTWMHRHFTPEDDWSFRHEKLGVDLEEILDSKRASATETAAMMWHMLKALGIEARVLLCTPRDQASIWDSEPGPEMFSHIVLLLPGGRLLLPSDPFTPLGMVPPELEGRQAMAFTGQKPSAFVMPVSKPDDNQTTISLTGRIDAAGIFRGTGRIVSVGADAAALRRVLSTLKGASRDEAVTRYFSGQAGVEVEGVTFGGLEDADGRLTFEARITQPSVVERTTGSQVLRLSSLIRDWLPDLGTGPRTQPIWFDHPRVSRLELDVALPPGCSPTLPEQQDDASPALVPLRVRSRLFSSGPGRVMLEQRLVVGSRVIEAEQAAAAQAALEYLKERGDALVVLGCER